MERPVENRTDIVSVCRDWWSVDAELDVLTAQHSSVETEFNKKFGTLEAARADGSAAALLRPLRNLFDRRNKRRASCGEADQDLPVRTVEDPTSKLAIAARSLNDQAGLDAAVVEELDALKWLQVRAGRKTANRGLANVFLQNALSFTASALEMRSLNPHASEHFLAIGIELSLKSYLLRLGVTDEWNRRHIRHDLAKALRFARVGGLNAHSAAFENIARRLGAHYQKGGFARSSEPLISAQEWEVATKSVAELIHIVDAAFREGATGQALAVRKR